MAVPFRRILVRLAAFALGIAAVLAPLPSEAAARWWNPGATNPSSGGNGNWGQTTPTIWSTSNTTATVGAYSTGTAAQQATFAGTSGTVTVNGTVYISGANTAPGSAGLYAATPGTTYAFNGTGTIQLGAAAFIHGFSNVSYGSGLTINNAGFDLTFSNGGIVDSLVSGSGTVTKGGGGTLRLNNTANNYSGVTTLNQGILEFTSIGNVGGGASALGAPATVADGTIAISNSNLGGTLRYIGTTNSSSNRTIRLGGSTTSNNTVAIDVFSSGNLTITASNTAAGGAKTLTLQGSSTGIGEFTAPIVDSSGTIGIAKDGTGTWILSGNNTYTGATTIAAGTLQIGNGGGAGTLATTSAITNNATLVFNRTGTVTQGTNFGTISGTGLVVQDGGGTLVLGTGSSYTGGTRVTAGTLQMASGTTALGSNAGTLTVNGGLVDTSNNSLTVGNLTGTGGTISGTSGARTFTIGQGNGSGGNFQGVIANGSGGTTALVKTGTGTITLSGANTYTGTTAVNGGTLAVNGSLGNTAVTVGASGLLGGSGVMAGALSVDGTLAPGSSIESLGAGALTFNATSTYAYELQTNLYGTTPAVAADLAYSSGTLDIVPGAVLTLTDLATSTALTPGDKLTLISYSGGWTSGELFTYLGNTLANGATFTLGANQWQFAYDDTSGGPNYAADQVGATAFVTITVVPEPATLGLIGVCGAGVLVLVRRRMRRA